MAEEPQQQNEQQEVRTAQDVRMDQLTARLDALEAENRKLREANASLYAMSNPVREDPSQQEVPQQPVPEKDIALDSFNQNIYGGM